MKTDARVRYTKSVIKESFITLLKQQPLNKIKVKELCELAQINRATFYSHYYDCFDLIEQIENELMRELEIIIEESKYRSTTDIFINILKQIKENGDLYITITSENGDRNFSNRILTLYYNKADIIAEKQFPNLPKNKREWLYYFSANGCSGILHHWISTGMKADISEVAEFINQLIKNLNTT